MRVRGQPGGAIVACVKYERELKGGRRVQGRWWRRGRWAAAVVARRRPPAPDRRSVRCRRDHGMISLHGSPVGEQASLAPSVDRWFFCRCGPLAPSPLAFCTP